MKKLSICIVFVMFFFQVSFGNIYYVSTTGNDISGDGSAGMPWRTLKYAVTRVAANLDHTIQLTAGTFIENGLVEVPLGVNVIGAGIDQTILRAASSFYYNPATPGYATDKFLISLNESSPQNGNQTLKDFTIDGDSKKLHGGIYVHYRNNVTIDGVKVQNTNFTGIWLWDVKSSKIKYTQLINCSWGSTSYCSGALNLGNVESLEVDHITVDESIGYGIKAIGPGGNNNIINTKIHDSRISVNPFGVWNGGSAPNIAIELWSVNLVGNEIYNNYVDNTISLVNSNATPSTGVQTIRVHHNTIDMNTRAGGAGYGVELTIHDAEVDHNYFVKGNYGIANWDKPMINWNIHHNTFFAIQGTYPGEVVRSQWSGLHNVKFYSNTIEFASNKTMNVVGLYGGTSDNVDIQNNLFMDNNTGYSYYPNQLVHLENNAVLTTLAVKNNLFSKLPVGSAPGTYLNNITTDPLINSVGSRADPYYLPKTGSPLIDAGVNLGFVYLGSAPDIGAFEYAAVTNVAPQINITSPANNSNFNASATVTIDATATDTDGVISKVEFYNGATLLGQDLASPYSFAWSGVPAGNYSLTAKATDNQNGVTTSAIVSITVANVNVPPVVSLTSPANNASFTTGSSVTMTANASDSNGTISKVEFFYGTTLIGQSLTSPYSFVWVNVSTGVYSLTAKATDNQSAVTTSTAVAISVVNVNVPPVVSLTSPTNNTSFTTGSSVTLAASATDSNGTISKVEFFDGTKLLGLDNTSPYSFVWANLQPGTYLITAKATDNQSAATTSTAVMITVTNANVPPVVSLTSPTNNTSFTVGTSVTVSANATDTNGTVSKVEFYNGATLLGVDITSPYSFVWTNVPAGSYSLTAKAIDNQNAMATSAAVAITVTSVNVPPVVSLTSPSNNTNFTAGTSVTISANATDSNGTISKVEFYNGVSLLGQSLTSPYKFVWTNIPAGNYSLTARATDNQNAVTTSAAVAIVVIAPNIAPAVSLTAPITSANFTTGSNVTITANATDSDGSISKVEFYNGAILLGQSVVAPYSFAWNSVPAGTFALSVSATDNMGATTTSSSITITVSTPALLQLGFDSSDATLSGQMTLGYDDTAAMGTYFSVPPGNGRNYYIPAPAIATFNFNVPKADNFVIWAKVKSLSDQNQGHYIYNGKGKWFTWQAGIHTNWTWVKITDAGADALFAFASGANSFQMAWFDENAQVDQIVITNDRSFLPAQDPVVSSQFIVYPNPVVANYFTIQYTSSVSQQAQVSIFDNASTLIKQIMVNLNAGVNDVVVDINYIYNGNYIVTFQPTNGQKSTARIIISR